MKLKINQWIKDNNYPLIFFAALLICMITLFTVYKLYGYQLVKVTYEAGWVKKWEGANTNPLEHYIGQADFLFFDVMKNLFFTSFFFIFTLITISIFMKGKDLKVRPIEWFCLIAGLFLSQWYFWIMEDAYIFLRYIDNLLFLKIGLVYNKGEYVEGFSSPLWVLLLALLRATGRNWELIFRLITIVSFVLFWFMLVKLNRRLSPLTNVINFPLIYLTFNYAVLCHFSSWMETPIVQVLAPAYALYILNPGSLILQVMLALSPLVRHELIIPFVFCSVWTWLYYKKFPLKLVLMMITFVGSWVLFRIYYYADLFPNTFYLKDMVSIKQGLIYVHDTLGTYHFYFIMILFVVLIVFLKRRGVELKLPKRAMMILVALSIALYVVKIGGDWVHYRYLAFPFILAVCSFSGILEHFVQAFNLNKYRLLAPLTGIILSLIFFSFYPIHNLKNHPIFLGYIYNMELPEDKTKWESIFNKFKITDAPSLIHVGRRRHFGYYSDMKAIIEENKEFKYEEVEVEPMVCQSAYENLFKRIILGAGLTDAILARIQTDKIFMAGHKPLLPFAEDILYIHKSSEYIGRGMYRKVVEEDRAPEWIIKNLDTIEIIERKIYNTHHFWENFKLAFTFPPRIKP
jgi:hypothetical protein